MKVASTVRRGAVGKGRFNHESYLAGRLPYGEVTVARKHTRFGDERFIEALARVKRDPLGVLGPGAVEAAAVSPLRGGRRSRNRRLRRSS